MGIADKLVLNRQRHLKWKALDDLEMILMIICGLTLFGFSMSVCADITTRIIGRPWLWLQEVTSTLFIYGIFIGAAVATRRNDHLYLTAFAESMHGNPRLAAELINSSDRARGRCLPDLLRLSQLFARFRQFSFAVEYAYRLPLCSYPVVRNTDRPFHHRADRQRLPQRIRPPRTAGAGAFGSVRRVQAGGGRNERPGYPCSHDGVLSDFRLSRCACAVCAAWRRVCRCTAVGRFACRPSSRKFSTASTMRLCLRSLSFFSSAN